MNENSVLCRFLAAHPADWEERLSALGIRMKRGGALCIFNYNITSDFSLPEVAEARGIILDTEKREVVCWPFRKFGNYNESYADRIDWQTARVQEKVDGSIVKLWFDGKRGAWQFSTNGCIRAEEASVDGRWDLKYGDLIRKAENYGEIPFDALDREKTYIFELVSPEAPIVVAYPKTLLYHIGTRSNLTGREETPDIGLPRPKEYPLSSLEDCLRAAAALNATKEAVTEEGFVVVDGDFRRVKIKSPDYLVTHRLKFPAGMAAVDCLRLLLEMPEKADAVMEANPRLVPRIRYFQFRLAELVHLADRMGELAKKLYEEYSHDRRAVAGVILSHRLSFVGFRCLESEMRGGEYLLTVPAEKLAKLIPDYEEEDLSLLFLPKKA